MNFTWFAIRFHNCHHTDGYDSFAHTKLLEYDRKVIVVKNVSKVTGWQLLFTKVFYYAFHLFGQKRFGNTFY